MWADYAATERRRAAPLVGGSRGVTARLPSFVGGEGRAYCVTVGMEGVAV